MSTTQWYIGAPNAVVLCFRRGGEKLSGELYHSYSAEPVPFRNPDQMLHHMEALYDSLRFPFPGTNERSFTEHVQNGGLPHERKKIMSDETLLSKRGDIGTFIVRVQHRQNSSWQGRLTWMEEDKTISFRSIWEMIKLIESAVDSVSNSEEAEEPSWFPKES